MIELDACGSTQDEVLARLDHAAPGAVVAVRAMSQRAGRGREGRAWQDAPGERLLLSVGLRGPASLDVLEDLPRRVVDALVAELVAQGACGLAWKAPNDVLDAQERKVAGVLVDARTVADRVQHVVVGIGANLVGPSFTTPDGRAAAAAFAEGSSVDTQALARGVADRIEQLLGAAPRATDA